MKFGLLGRKLGHSYSPQIHKALGSFPYELLETEPQQIREVLSSGKFQGLNITIPYKKTVLPYCTALTPEAEALGAVNTLIKLSDGGLLGHNSDYGGFLSLIHHENLDVKGKKILILGSGGASAVVKAALKSLGAIPVVISRTGKNHYGNLFLHRDAAAIVNTTPVGMFPDNGNCPIDLTQFSALQFIIDLIYNPARTKLMMNAEAKGITAYNGLWMLIAQAKESAEYFLDCKFEDGIVLDIYRSMKKKMQNIILIGMPGSGKSTIGAILAQQLGRKLIDTDKEIVRIADMSIPEIFRIHGEGYFRKLEADVIHKYGKESSLILATGGGCVTVQENYEKLHQNGVIFWIKRPIVNLPSDGRPLSEHADLNTMYRRRAPLYQAFSDFSIDNIQTPKSAAEAILKGYANYENSGT